VLSTRLLDDCLVQVPNGRAAILVRNQSGTFVTVAQSADDVPWDVVHDPTVRRCWTTSKTVQAAVPASPARADPSTTVERSPDSPELNRCALPLLVGTDMVGVLVVDTGRPVGAGKLAELAALLGERALPLHTAMLFDQVRTLATVEERHRLAREIHDGVAQEVASLAYLVDDLAAAPAAARVARTAHLRGELTRIVDDLRMSIFDLRSHVGRTSSLGSVLGDYLLEVGSRSGTAVVLKLDETPERLRPEVAEQLLRIVQEAVTNARKHSGAANLWVTCVVRPPAAHVIVEDDGSGICETGRANSFGVGIMRERAGRIGATLEISGRAGGGTRVSVRLTAPSPKHHRATGETVADRPAPHSALHEVGSTTHG
jgi:signal transduction histidine kinase